jgi:hypothetical protein
MAIEMSHAEWDRLAQESGAAALAQRVYRQYTGSMDEQEVADKIFAAVRAKGHSYIMAARLAWTYA